MICGIDPGLSGGIAFIHDGLVIAHRAPVRKFKMNKKERKYLDVGTIASWLEKHEPSHIFIEKQQAMPGQGVSSTFMTGLGYGIYIGMFISLGFNYTEVTPRQWKKDLEVPKDKNLARARATELYPHASDYWRLKCEDGVAEATMIAHWGIEAMCRMGQSDQ